MARSRVADGSDGLQIRRVTANILNRQSMTVDKTWSFSLGVGRGAYTSSPKEAGLLGLGPILWNDLGNGMWMWDLEHVRSHYRSGLLKQ